MTYDMDAVFKDSLNYTLPQSKTGNFDFWRPDYTNTLTPEVKLNTSGSLPTRVTAAGNTYSKTKLPGVQYFNIFCLRNTVLASGDVLLRNPAHNTPPITLLEIEDLSQAVGFKSSSFCSIYSKRPVAGSTNLIASNVRFNFMGVQTPEGGIEDTEPGSWPIEQRRMAFFTRPELKQGVLIKVTVTGKVYEVEEIQPEDNLTIAILKIAGKSG